MYVDSADTHIAIADALSCSANRSATDPPPRASGVALKKPAIGSSTGGSFEGRGRSPTEESETNEASHRRRKRAGKREGKG